MREVKAPAAHVVAAFDFDGTVTRRDTLLPYLLRGLGGAGFLWAMVQSGPWLAAYACGLISNHRAKARLLRASLGGRRVADVEQWSLDFVARYLPQQWQAATLARLRWHQAQGHCCMMVSASPDIYLHHVGELLGMEAVLCTELEVSGDRLTGRMLTRNCHGEEKVLRLQAWLAQRGWPRERITLHAYGDSSGDVPLLNLADYAHYRGQPWARTTPGPQ